MLDLIVFIKAEGINVRLDNLQDTITSFEKNNPDLNYKFYLVLERSISIELINSIGGLLDERAIEITEPTGTWAQDFNSFLDKRGNEAEWLLISHDDVEFVTENYFKKMTNPLLALKEEIGFITSTSEHYYKNLNQMRTDTFRPGFYRDRGGWPFIFQLHNNDINNLDYPNAPVKIHGPMSAVMLITMHSMKKVGYCEDWTPYTMMIDEDWSLEALKNNLWNVWVPDVHHLHPNRFSQRKSFNRWTDDAHSGLFKKWGFEVGRGGEHGCSIGVEELRSRWGHTLIPWSSYRNSYDWEFLNG